MYSERQTAREMTKVDNQVNFKSNKSDGKCRNNPRLPRSVYVQRVETVEQSGPWNSLVILACAEDGDHETVRPVKQSRYSWLYGG